MTFKAFTGALAAVLMSGAAMAADLPSRKAAVEVAPAPMFTWTGFYVGVNVGYASNVSNGNYGGLQVLPPATWNHLSNWGGGTGSGGGVIGGAQVGYNFQVLSNLVAGIEADIQGSSLKSSDNTIGAMPNGNGGSTQYALVGVEKRVEWFGTLRGRLGFTIVPTFLVYATGGLAYGNVKQNVIANAWNVAGASAVIGGGSSGSTRLGWTAGGGVEWAFLPNWSAKFEYLHTDLGSTASVLGGAGAIGGYFACCGSYAGSHTTRTSFNTFRVGVNYRFGGFGAAPVVARY